MTKSTILKLNQLNQDFYQKIAPQFNTSRQYFWPGWSQLNPYLQPLFNNLNEIRALDIGCGNGRWAHYLTTHWPTAHIYYEGLENNDYLIQEAKLQTQACSAHSLKKVDIVLKLLNNEQLTITQFEIITMFGVLHHIPSSKLRLQLLTTLRDNLTPNGLLIFTTWNFLHNEQLMKRVVAPQTVSISPAELEPDDYILDWQKGSIAQRYCHAVQSIEVENIARQAGLSIKASFTAGLKGDADNHYWILQPMQKLKQEE